MVGTVNGNVQGHVGTLNFTASFTQAVADGAAAQALCNSVKSFFTVGGAAVDQSSWTFMPQSTSGT
jgi:hypothetical protein